MQLLPLTLEMAELNGNEKHGRLPRSLPVDAMRPGTIRTEILSMTGFPPGATAETTTGSVPTAPDDTRPALSMCASKKPPAG